MNREEIRQHVINQAVKLFTKAEPPNNSGMFTTAHYAQALKAEFSGVGPVLDSTTCTEHLEAMADIEKAGGCIWRRKAQAQQDSPAQSDITETTQLSAGEIETRIEAGVLHILSGCRSGDTQQRGVSCLHATVGTTMCWEPTHWWSIEIMTIALSSACAELELDDDTLENLVGLQLYTMVVDGRAVAVRNILVEGDRKTVFTLAKKGAKLGHPEGGLA